MRIAYLINQYPTVSHNFVRREILALKRQGFEILRIALRGWDRDLIHKEDELERKRTRYVLRERRNELGYGGRVYANNTPGAPASRAESDMAPRASC